MGCGASSTAAGAPSTAGSNIVIKETGGFKLADGEQACKGSKLFCPPNVNAGSTVPAVVVAHGCGVEGWVGDLVLDLLIAKKDWTWTYNTALSTALAEQGFAVLMIGMPDHDEQKYESPDVMAALMNAWPAADYSRFLSAAIDHLCKVAPENGVTVDKKRIGLVGHSMGGAGVLYAAARDCKDKVAAVAALHPGMISINKPGDHTEGAIKYLTGSPHSGENGEGTVEFLAEISAPTFIFGSQAEMNVELLKGQGMAPMWPVFTCQFEQVGARIKELYVDNIKENPGSASGLHGGCLYAHTWFADDALLHNYGDGAPLKAICGFLRRRLAGSMEAVMARPSNAKEWVVSSPDGVGA